MEPERARRGVAEGLGTLILVATVVGSGIMAERSTDDVALALLGNTLATASILIVLIWVFGPISGAHFNPAVTLAMRFEGKISSQDSLMYAAAQVVGAILGMFLAHVMFFEKAWLGPATTERGGLGPWISEFVATFGLVITILRTLRFGEGRVGPAVGLYIAAGYWFTASTSFANPAVTLGRIWTPTFSGILPSDAPGFIVVQLAGAAAAWAFSRWLGGEPE